MMPDLSTCFACAREIRCIRASIRVVDLKAKRKVVCYSSLTAEVPDSSSRLNEKAGGKPGHQFGALPMRTLDDYIKALKLA